MCVPEHPHVSRLLLAVFLLGSPKHNWITIQRVLVFPITCATYTMVNGTSIPCALILSVLLVKLARVYRLFPYHHVITKKWQCHDLTLALYVLLLTSPSDTLCVLIQSAVDDFQTNLVLNTNNGIVVAFYDCQSDSEFFWILARQLYIYCYLNVILLILALKSRKINHSNFKDTKKVITVVFTTLVTSCWSFVYYIDFETINAVPIYSYFLLSVSHAIFICECQLFLFAAKIFPVLRRG